jgi:hypothetical protein
MKKILLIIVAMLPMLILSCKKQNKIQNNYSPNSDTIVDAGEKYIKVILDPEEPFAPNSGFVPDKETAVKIAKAIWYPIYGEEDKNRDFKNYAVALIGDTAWFVTREFNSFMKREGNVVTISLGGEPYILIRKKDGKILKVTHTK